MLKYITIEHYKGFFEEQKIEFAIPRSQRGSGLTVLVGPNNSGKTTIFDAISKLSTDKKFFKGERHEAHNPRIVICDRNDGNQEISNIENGAQIHITGQSKLNSSSFEFISSRRQWNHRFNGVMNRGTYRNQRFNLYENKYELDHNFGGVLADINRKATEKNKFTQLVKKIVPYFNEWTIDSDEHGDYIEYTTHSGITHNTSLFGDGLISLFKILTHLCNEDTSAILLIDEPELSLHPQGQKALADHIFDVSGTKQIIVSTHSPHFISWEALKNGAVINRLNKRGDLKCEAFKFTKDNCGFENLLHLSDEYQKPHLMDTVAKEIFFVDNVVFVEGQEDCGLLRNYISQNHQLRERINFELFGYGAGGAGNIYYFLRLAQGLGINAGALFDLGMEAEKNKCMQDFSNYLIQSLPTSDIRDKLEKNIEGVFNRDGTMKPAYKDGVENIIDNFISHFQR